MENEVIVKRLETLKDNSPSEFGIMTPQHMVEHLILTIKLSYGRIKIPEFEPSEKQLLQKQTLLYSEITFPRGVKIPALGDQLLPLHFPDLPSAKLELSKSLNEYRSYFEANPKAKTTHPRFGKLSHDEWDRFHKKHIDHHFEQFGI
jgi:hypothetical protein